MNLPDRDDYSLPEAPEPRSGLPTRIALMLAGIGALAAGIHFVPRAEAAESKKEVPAMAPAKVTVSTVEQQTLAEHRELIGRVDARETVEIRPRVPGHIDDVRFQAGSVVEKGDILFVIDPRQYRAQVDLAAAAVERAKVRL
ncbi:MAG TPA: biotin/lipoyl-binding protein, partial [Haloferula sp.]